MADNNFLKQDDALPESSDGELPLDGGLPRVKAGVATLLVESSAKKMALLCGMNDAHLVQLGRLAGVKLWARGEAIFAQSTDRELLAKLAGALRQLRIYVEQGIIPERSLLIALLDEPERTDRGKCTVGGCSFFARNRRQEEYLQAMNSCALTFALGPAGTGKTFLAVALALEQLMKRSKRLLILSRPVIEAGENLGFLPGSYADKLDPYLKPLYDAVVKLVGGVQFERLRQTQQIEIAPLAYMRGRTLDNAFIILDEAQNSTKKQMKLFLTRLGENSTTVVTGDPSQVDLPDPADSGLEHAVGLLKGLPGVAHLTFSSRHVIRSELVQLIVEAYQHGTGEG